MIKIDRLSNEIEELNKKMETKFSDQNKGTHEVESNTNIGPVYQTPQAAAAVAVVTGGNSNDTSGNTTSENHLDELVDLFESPKESPQDLPQEFTNKPQEFSNTSNTASNTATI